MHKRKVLNELVEAPFKIAAANLGLAHDVMRRRPVDEAMSTFLHRLPFADQVFGQNGPDATPGNMKSDAANIRSKPGVAGTENAPKNAAAFPEDARPDGPKVHPQVKLARKAEQIVEENTDPERGKPISNA
ncbi:hypothetical protein [Pontivivens insulae]|uniref:Uncharacterized protein n=1 Tax=Pontivivens insulae TaxID=1639689 RepID=A0A2R8AFB8_9RHOB|nr:hypothetical protein [Pontivivens insulae]RED12042.1 hypothetical protein DFR53_2755 [Pontivivens insulae]SPF30798.1 hypothetical protein POI8812_03141 [Pontivivens insulae]